MNPDEEAYNKFIFVSEDDQSEGSAPKQPKTKQEQFQLIEDFTKKYSEATTGKDEYDQLWNNLAVELNDIGPPVRNAMDWRRVWSVYKYNKKRKQSAKFEPAAKRSRESQSPSNSTPLPNNPNQQTHLSQRNDPSQSDDPRQQNNPSRPESPSQPPFAVESRSIQASSELCSVLQVVLQKLDKIIEILLELRGISGQSS